MNPGYFSDLLDLLLGGLLIGDLVTPSSLYGSGPNQSEEVLLIAAASNLRFAMNEIAAEFGGRLDGGEC